MMLKNMTASFNTWHKLFGHPGNDKLNALGKLLSIEWSKEEKDCDICFEAKQRRNTFQRKANRCEKTLQCLHMDLVGPINPVTIGDLALT
jgi:GAG-pre-integrase domain